MRAPAADLASGLPFVRDVEAVCNLGSSWPEIWRALLAGEQSSLRHRDVTDRLALDLPVAAVHGLDRRLTPGEPVEGAAGRLARLVVDGVLARRDGARTLRTHGGINHGETDLLEALAAAHHEGTELPHAHTLWRAVLVDPIAEYLAEHHGGLQLGSWSYSACTSSLHALVAGVMDLLENPDAEALVLGVDPLSSAGIAGFARSGAYTAGRCSPLREGRDGLMAAEGAAAMRLSHEPGDGEMPIRILGLGMSCDAGDPTRPNPEGIYLREAISTALESASLEPSAVGGVVLHGTGTPINDAVEAKVYEAFWPDRRIPVTSVKGSIGHTMGVSGLFNCLVAVEASRSGMLPPTVGESEPLAELDLATGAARRLDPGAPIVVSCSGFGGNNVCAIFGADP